MTEVNECKVYVGNLPFSVGFEELKEIFSSYGEITEATVIVNHYTGRSKGFGFVTFSSPESAKKAITGMDGKEVKGRNLKVKAAQPPKERDNKEEKTESKPEKTEEKPIEEETEKTEEKEE